MERIKESVTKKRRKKKELQPFQQNIVGTIRMNTENRKFVTDLDALNRCRKVLPDVNFHYSDNFSVNVVNTNGVSITLYFMRYTFTHGKRERKFWKLHNPDVVL